MSDVFRKEYKALSQEVKDNMLMFKERAETLLNEFNLAETTLPIDNRCMALAKTNLEQSIMWAIKAIT